MLGLNVMKAISEDNQTKLREVGIDTVEKLSKATSKGIIEISRKTGIDQQLISTWSKNADLIIRKGIGSGYNELLENAGVDNLSDWNKFIQFRY